MEQFLGRYLVALRARLSVAVPFELERSELLRLRNSPSKAHLVEAIVAYCGQDPCAFRCWCAALAR